MKWVPLILLFFITSQSAPAAYRVYKLKVRHFDEKGKFKSQETVLSSLDHLQYEHYYGGYRWDAVELMDTWYCPGDTSRRKLCDKPVESERGPASMEKPTRLPLNLQPVIP